MMKHAVNNGIVEIVLKDGKRYSYHPYFNTLVETSDTFDANTGITNNTISGFDDKLPSFLPYPVDSFSYDKVPIPSHKKKIVKIVFCMTYDCNFRCKYCVYGPKYSKYGYSTYNKEAITYDIIIQTIYYVINMYNSDEYELVIGFYGGEPLLQFNLVKQAIKNLSVICQNYKVVYSLTTNGSLIDDQMIEFFKEYCVNIFISIDGDADTHDSNRVDLNGQPTHEKVYSNIRNIFNHHPRFFESYVYFNATYDSDTNLQKVASFFIEEKDYFPPHRIQFSNVIDIERTNNNNNNESYFTDIISFAFSKLVNQYNVRGIDDYKELFEYNLGSKLLFEQIGMLHESLNISKINNRRIYPSGCCYPGRDILYVDPEGNYYYCKSLTDKHNCIGNVNIGIKEDDVNKIVARYEQMMLDKCKNCWAISLCKQCFFSLGTNMNVNVPIEDICEKYREKLYDMLVSYCEILSVDKHFFIRHSNKLPRRS